MYAGWFGFNVWLGAQAIYGILQALFSNLSSADPHLGSFLGVTLLEFLCFLAFLFVHMIFVYKGIESMKIFEVIASPLLGVSALCLIIWAWVRVGSLSEMLEATKHFSSNTENLSTSKWYASLSSIGLFALSSSYSFVAPLYRFVHHFLPALTAMVGGWSTMALNILDFTRYSSSA